MKSSPDKLAYQKQYYKSHRAEGMAAHKAWLQFHKEEQAIQKAAYYRAHCEGLCAYSAAYRAEHGAILREKAARKNVWFIGNLNILKAAQGCTDCGAHEGELLHHHLDPSKKLRGVSQMATCSLEAFLEEIAKCAVLCRPCHRKRHAAMRLEQVVA